MLVLTRRIGESVVIGDKVFITVMGVKGNQVRLGTTAPKWIPVYRGELFKKPKMIKPERGNWHN